MLRAWPRGAGTWPRAVKARRAGRQGPVEYLPIVAIDASLRAPASVSPCYDPAMDPTRTPLSAAPPDALPALCRRFHVRRLDLFGSAADGRFNPARSDLDFLVAFEALPGSAYADAYFGLRDGLAALFGQAVDLVTEPALENPYLRRQVERQRRRLFPSA